MNEARSFVLPFLLLGLIVAVGAAGFQIIEDLDPVAALYMTLITMSTVGFGEVGHSFSTVGRLFTMGLIVTSVTVGAYCIGLIIAYIVEGRLMHAVRRRHMTRKIGRMSGHIIVCGTGRSGGSALREFRLRGKEVVAIEFDEVLAEEYMENDASLLLVRGNCTEEHVLEEAGVGRASSIVFAVPDTEAIIGTLTARSMNPGITIVCRAESEETARKLAHAGADHIIQPEAIAGARMATFITAPAVVEFLEIAMNQEGTELRMEELNIPEGGPLVGQLLAESGIREEAGASVIGLKRGAETMLSPSLKTTIEAGDTLIVLGESPRLARYRKAHFLL
ncbi:MAG: potassium channel protein [Gemmatimonadetes bacterium]|nr:potassium channel protein [Gemmatimonadota bacterium]